MRLHAGGAVVVWPGMLFPNSSGYSSCCEPRLYNFLISKLAIGDLSTDLSLIEF